MYNNISQLAIIGDPVNHSLSPILQKAMLNELGIKAEYSKILVEKNNLQSWILSNECSQLQGFNVTMPHKNEILKYMYSLSKRAERIGAVNTVVRRGNKLCGHNTDGIGFVRSLEAENIDTKANIAILGAGGAAIACADALLEAGANISIYARKHTQNFDAKIKILPWENLFSNTSEKKSELTSVNILINATPLGMKNHKDFDSLNFLESLNSDALVCDLIYKPLETQLLKKSKLNGFKTMSGLAMLVHQGIIALERFLDTQLNVNKMLALATSAIEEELSK